MIDWGTTQKMPQLCKSASWYDDMTLQTGRAARRAADDIIILSTGKLSLDQKFLLGE